MIQSRSRRVVLQSPPRPELQFQSLLVPDGTTDRQVLEWTRGWLPEAAWGSYKHCSARRLSASSGIIPLVTADASLSQDVRK